jgi:anaplastic lymphoma kinase
VNKAVPLIVAGGGGGLGVGRYLDENVQQAKGIVLDRPETSGLIENEYFEELKSAGPGGNFFFLNLFNTLKLINFYRWMASKA